MVGLGEDFVVGKLGEGPLMYKKLKYYFLIYKNTYFLAPLLLTSSSRRLARRTDSIIREGDDFQVNF